MPEMRLAIAQGHDTASGSSRATTVSSGPGGALWRRLAVAGSSQVGRLQGPGQPACLAFTSTLVLDWPPGRSRGVRGWTSFFDEGPDIRPELKKVAVVAFGTN